MEVKEHMGIQEMKKAFVGDPVPHGTQCPSRYRTSRFRRQAGPERHRSLRKPPTDRPKERAAFLPAQCGMSLSEAEQNPPPSGNKRDSRASGRPKPFCERNQMHGHVMARAPRPRLPPPPEGESAGGRVQLRERLEAARADLPAGFPRSSGRRIASATMST